VRSLAGPDAVVELSTIITGAIAAAEGLAALTVPVKTEQHPAEADALDVHRLTGFLTGTDVRTAGALAAENELHRATFRKGSGNRVATKEEKVQKINAVGEVYRTAGGGIPVHIRRLGAGQWNAPEEEVVENVHRVGEIDFEIQVGITPEKRGAILCSYPRCNQNDCQED
jgi:hypothetical protein